MKRRVPEKLYKYLDFLGAQATLKNGTRKWTSPLSFNDPFDTQLDVDLLQESDEFLNRLANKVINKVLSGDTTLIDKFPEALKHQLRLFNKKMEPQKRRKFFLQVVKPQLIISMQSSMSKIRRQWPLIQDSISKLMSLCSVLCLSETHESILMWSHYGKNHTGAVIEFSPFDQEDSPLIKAEPITYASKYPALQFDDFGIFSLDKEAFPQLFLSILTLTKSQEWAYEREWRVVDMLHDFDRMFDLEPFHPSEVGAVYLGCKMPPDEKQEIVEITRANYPHVKIFEMNRKPNNFLLEPDEIPNLVGEPVKG